MKSINPHRYAHLPEPELEEIMLDMIRQTGFLQDVLTRAQELNLPNWRVVSGALYNTVWNVLTGRPEGYGIKDVDILYYEPDTSWEAEDRGAFVILCHFCKLKKRNDTCEKILILMRRWLRCKRAKALRVRMVY